MKQVNRFSKSSLERIKSIHPNLIKLANRALDIAGLMGKDFSVIEGHRSEMRQQELFEAGFSTTMDSKHRYLPSLALDFLPWHSKEGSISGNSLQVTHLAEKYGHTYEMMQGLAMAEFQIIAMCFIQAASELDIPITWGGDWNRDSSTFDTKFQDWGHIELLEIPNAE